MGPLSLIPWLSIVFLGLIPSHACASFRSRFSVQLPSGRLLSLSTHTFRSLNPNRHRRTTGVSAHFNINKHLFELIETSQRTFLRNLQGNDIDVRDIFMHGDHTTVPPLSGTYARDNVDPEVWTLDGISIVTLQSEILGVWSLNMSLLPLDQLQYPGVYTHHPSSSKSRVIKEISPLPFSLSSSTTRQRWTPSQRPCLYRKVVKEVEVALAYDHSLCSKYGHSKAKTNAAVRGALEVANIPYANQTCLRLRTVNVTGECEAEKDPYNGFDRMGAGDILDAFARHWWRYHSNLHRDVVMFLPGFQEASAVSGVAFLGAACNMHHGMGWGEELSPIVMAHEIGHLLGAYHAEKGIMRQRWKSNDVMVFSNDSIIQISNFVDLSPISKCLSVVSKIPDKEPITSPTDTSPSQSLTSSPRATASPSTKASKSVTAQPSPSVTPSISESPQPSSTPSASMTTSIYPSSSNIIKDAETIRKPISSVTITPSKQGTATQTTNVAATRALPNLPSTCSTGWNRWNLLRCTAWKRLARHKIWIASSIDNKMTIVWMNVFLRQAYGLFQLRYRVFNLASIRSMGVMMTLNNPAIANVSINDEEVNSVRETHHDLRSDQIELIKGWKSCCNKRMRIYTKAKICRRGVCKIVLFRLGFNVQCRACRSSRVFQISYMRIPNSTDPQPPQRRCPRCVR